MKFSLSVFLRYCDHKVFGSLPTMTLTFDVFTHLRVRIHLWRKLGEIPFIGFWDMVFTRFWGRTDLRTHSRTDRPEYRLPPSPFFNGDVGIKIPLCPVI